MKPIPESQESGNLRLRQKQNTRLLLMDTAIQLFVEQGYENVKLTHVAEKADIHVQTLYKHFKTKAALATSYFDLYLDKVLEVINAYESEQDIFQLWKDAAIKQLKSVMEVDGSLEIFRMIHANQELLTYTQYRVRLVEDALCEAFLRQLNDGKSEIVSDEFEARLLAAELIAAFRDAHFTWIHSGGKVSSLKRFRKFLEKIDQSLGLGP